MDTPEKIIKPPRLLKNNQIALIAPAGPVKQEQIDKTQKVLSAMGYKSCYNQSILSRKGYLAGSDDVRLNELHLAFERKDVDAIICIRGGYGSSRIVDKIDFELLKQNPKIFIGYSDITVLLNSIYQQTGLITFHGVVGISSFSDYTRSIFTNILTLTKDEFLIYPKDKESLEIVNSGKASGRLAGGNLSMIVSLLGTKFQPDFTNKLVFLEDIGEAPYRIDRMLTQLLLSGCLEKASGIILGNFKNCDIDNIEITSENSLSLNEIITDRLSLLNKPTIKGFSFGHMENQAIFPVGCLAELNTNVPGIKLLECPVS